jgi:hypothetical protein
MILGYEDTWNKCMGWIYIKEVEDITLEFKGCMEIEMDGESYAPKGGSAASLCYLKVVKAPAGILVSTRRKNKDLYCSKSGHPKNWSRGDNRSFVRQEPILVLPRQPWSLQFN